MSFLNKPASFSNPVYLIGSYSKKMNRLKLCLLLLFLLNGPFGALSQVISTSPALPKATDEITVTFDATNTPLEGYLGDVYAHTGVLTTESANNTQWKYVIESWGNNDTQPKLTRDSENANKYTMVISSNVYSFYNIPESVEITHLAFVFRAAENNGQPQTENLYVEIYEDGLNLIFTAPTSFTLNLNESVTISAEASINSDLNLYIDDVLQKTENNNTVISISHTFTTPGNHKLKATANAGSESMETEFFVYVKSPTQNATQPSGLNYGINKNPDNSVTFLLKAPNKTDVFLIGDFNDWLPDANYQMFKDGDDFWLTLTGLNSDLEYGYQYYIDYDISVADPYAEKVLHESHDMYIPNSTYPDLKEYPQGLTNGYVSTFKINEEEYNWNITDFDKPDQHNLIIYELLIRDFTTTESFNEALTRLDYLERLGVNAIELLPINEFEGNDSWGYNPDLYMALDKAYGTKNDFKKFVDACHERGIAVLADVVFNHSKNASPLAQMYWNNGLNRPAADNPWYNEEDNFIGNETPGSWGPDFNHESEHTVSFFNDVLTYWIEEYKIDGFRFDFTKGMSNTIYTDFNGQPNWGNAYDADRIAILKNYADHVWSHDPLNKPYVIFEHLADNSEEKELADYGIMLWGNLNHSYNQNTMGYSEDSNIEWISYKKRNWNNSNMVGYMESHDEERLMYKNLEHGNSNGNYDVKELNTALSRQELAGMFLFSIPGPKMIWQFGELGYEFSINADEYGVVHYNPPGSDNVDTGYRTHRKPIRWDYTDNDHRMHVYNTWSNIIALKKKYPDVFNTDDFSINDNGLTKSIILEHTSMDVLILGNFDVSDKSVNANFTKTGTWYEYFTGEEKNVSSTNESLVLMPGEYRLYSTQRIIDARGGNAEDDSDGDGVTDPDDLCPNTFPGTEVDDSGCEAFSLAADNFTIEVTSESCVGSNDGKIVISSVENNYSLSTFIDGETHTFNVGKTISGLEPGTYDFCIAVEGESYEQCFSVTIEAGQVMTVSSKISSKKMNIEVTHGTAPFTVKINGNKMMETMDYSFGLPVSHGDVVEVYSKVLCEGVYSEKVSFFDSIVAYPNPTRGTFELSIPFNRELIEVELYTSNYQLISKKNYQIFQGKIKINIESLSSGLYIAKVFGDEPVLIKIIKQ
jgi:1,4-alpha-glucan branching enzyme